MTKRQVAVGHLRTGKPLHLIAQEMDVSFQTIVRYMKLQVAEGGVTASEVFFGIDPARRSLLHKLLEGSDGKASKSYYRDAAFQGISWDEANLYWAMAFSTANRGDMYERVADLEVGLHQHIKDVLTKEFGETESAWWRNGVPLAVRKACVQAREEDAEPVDSPFAYTTFIHLSEIIEKNWSLFSANLPKSLVSNKQKLLADLKKLNSIRNAVMHPVKGKSWDQDDFAFVGKLLSELSLYAKKTGKASALIHRTVVFGAHR
ncbi:hypothetical protein [Pseudomonas linyingensis]|uniref:hypothetical protein n=1 Tax=Pseudomonas linyingensis TaxID=915471 RepID=UPI0011145094|nr:hypothetical protein [Pseudomonas linyingensis]